MVITRIGLNGPSVVQPVMADFKPGRGNAPALLHNTAARTVKSWDRLMEPKSVILTHVVSFSANNKTMFLANPSINTAGCDTI